MNKISNSFLDLFQKTKFAVLVVTLWLSAVIIGCSSETTIPDISTDVTSSPPPTLALEREIVSPILQSPVSPPSVMESQATAVVPNQLTLQQATALKPTSGTGLVVGRLFNINTKAPAPYVWLYLAKVTGPDENPQVLLDIGKAPLSISNENGVFYFQDISPGKYGIVLWTPVASFLLSESNSDYSLLFSVEANQVKNLEDIKSLIP